MTSIGEFIMFIFSVFMIGTTLLGISWLIHVIFVSLIAQDAKKTILKKDEEVKEETKEEENE